ncbi:PEP-CTERM sorting domain-containing protein [Microseira wollei]|uniref:Ice-binding protein C-terminal domain-containing protein n=1 Tax=Microseira wollei NIES-4236 TaxID=2530354 RepID=A0AAV3XDZ5_9CYAN|nr:PEP-CTERM sorting domain-containing protein [Microseira wollei]GET40748.1 hypothetical protein MiSe_55590 [Microseira wollei NIES-4236]
MSRFPTSKVILMASAMLGFAASPSLAITINFDNLSGAMTFYAGNPVPSQARISNQFLASSGVSFSSDSSGNSGVALVNLGFGHAVSGSNGIGAIKNGILSYSEPIFASFFMPSNPAIKAVTNFVSIKPDRWPDPTKSLLIEAFGVNGNLLGSFSAQDPSTLSISAAGIHSVKITGNGTAAFDDFTFNQVTAGESQSVPEPTSALGLLAFGVFGAGFLLKRFPASAR